MSPAPPIPTMQTATSPPGAVTYFKYDEADQLISEDNLLGTTNYSHGAGGNRTALDRDGKSVTYSYDAADQLVQAGTVKYVYDADGRLTKWSGPDATENFAYDAWGNLTRVTTSQGADIGYEYAPTGERVSRSAGGQKSFFVYDRFALLQELDADRKAVSSYVYAPGIDHPLAMMRGGKTYYYHPDRNGSIIALTDGGGNPVASFSYDALLLE